MRILREDSIGLVIDIQERLVPAMNNEKKLVSNISKFILGLKELSLPLIFTQQYSKGLGSTISQISDLVDNFSFIEKTSFSCCDEPSFIEQLNVFNPKNVIICGIESHVCVLQTAVDLKMKGLNPIVVFDCVSSRKRESIKLAKTRLIQEGILVTSIESILFEITRDAKDQAFKKISAIVK